jgi:hypothetical protein
MEMLPTDLLMVITKKVAQDLLKFGATSKFQHQLANKKAALRALNWDCLWYIVDHNSFRLSVDLCVGCPRFAWDSLYFRSLLPGLRYQFYYPPYELCNGIRWICNVNSPFPGSEEDYSTTNLCLSCRLDLELAWFLWNFRFLDLGFLW